MGAAKQMISCSPSTAHFYRIIMSLSIVSRFVCFFSLWIPSSTSLAFLVGAPLPTNYSLRSSKTSLYGSNPNDSDDNNDMDLSNFNPFQYQADKGSSFGNVVGMTGTQISLRKTNMQHLVSELLNVHGDNKQETKAILDSYKEFLLEPLDNMDAPLDPQSIYNGIDTRKERYHAYEKSVKERIAKASNTKSKQVLQEMMDYVLQFK
jgi:hypothetical protein